VDNSPKRTRITSRSTEILDNSAGPQSFLGHSGHMAELTQLGSFDSEKWLDIRGSANFTAACFVAKSHTSGVTIGALPRMLNHWGAPKKSQQCRKFFLQYSTFTPKRP